MPTNRQSHSLRQRPALYWALLEFATLADAWLDLKTARKTPGCRGQIMAALRRAITAFTHASAGRHPAKQIARVRAAMDDCEAGFMLLHRRVPDIVEEALRRIDQIVATVDQLDTLNLAEWLKVELSPPTPSEAGQAQSNTMMAVLRDIAERISVLWMPHVTNAGARPDA